VYSPEPDPITSIPFLASFSLMSGDLKVRKDSECRRLRRLPVGAGDELVDVPMTGYEKTSTVGSTDENLDYLQE